jgi:hypothetical protein
LAEGLEGMARSDRRRFFPGRCPFGVEDVLDPRWLP